MGFSDISIHYSPKCADFQHSVVRMCSACNARGGGIYGVDCSLSQD